MFKVSRRPHLAPQIVFADGISGSGKTALSMALSSLDRVEVHRLDMIYEQVCFLRYLGSLTEDAAVAMIRLNSDLACYDAMLGRGSNFRPGDISSVLLKKDLYEKRLTLPDGRSVLECLEIERPILHLMTHHMFAFAGPVFKALGDRLTFIEMVRHPIFLITAWYDYILRYGEDPLELDLCFDYQDRDLPWFCAEWPERYLAAGRMDRIILSLDFLHRRREEFVGGLSREMLQRLLIIPFKKFVSNPFPFIEKMERMLGAKRTDLTENVLRDQKIPRAVVTDCPDHEAFKKYGWDPSFGVADEEREMKKRWDLVRREASPDCLRMFEQMCTSYERTYLAD